MNTQKPYFPFVNAKWIVFLFLLQACTLDQERAVSLDDIDFDTRDDTELFFKNIRQSDYNLEENKAANINIYRLKDNAEDSTSSEPNPVIIHHWLRDKAYLWLEFGAQSSFEVPLNITVAYPAGKKVMLFDGTSPINHTEVALELFNAALTEAAITCDGKPILTIGSAARTNYKLVLNDYFRLLGLK